MSSRRPLDDVQLMQRIQQGDTAAFATFYDRHSAAAFGLAYRVVGSRALAEDVTQEAFIGFWRSRLEFSGERGAARAWLLCITRNRAIDAVRRPSHQRDQALGPEHEQVAAECTELEVQRLAEAGAVAVAIDTLPQHQREVVTMAYTDGLSQSEIATRLTVPIGTVKSRTRLALDKLRVELAAA